jgi:hypothetical protein|tara:strand:- start:1906 stop:2436 length:531 start_codon:yes stop_codon:yes gene_type:complete
MKTIFQISYGDLLSWIMLTFAAVIMLSFMYRFATQNRILTGNTETKKTEMNTPQKFIFISADVDEAISLLRSAHVAFEKNNFKESMKKTQSAISLVLSQLLNYFAIQNEESNVKNMFQMLHEKGVIIPAPQQGIARLDEIIKKANEDKLLTKEEIHWALHASGHIIESTKEVRIKE